MKEKERCKYCTKEVGPVSFRTQGKVFCDEVCASLYASHPAVAAVTEPLVKPAEQMTFKGKGW